MGAMAVMVHTKHCIVTDRTIHVHCTHALDDAQCAVLQVCDAEKHSCTSNALCRSGTSGP